MDEKHLEAAARYWCARKALDPEEVIRAAPYPFIPGGEMVRLPRWQVATRALRDHALLAEALEFARGNPPER